MARELLLLEACSREWAQVTAKNSSIDNPSSCFPLANHKSPKLPIAALSPTYFDVLVLDLYVEFPQPRGNLGNFLRGQIGAALRRLSCTCSNPNSCPRTCDYGRIFDPPRDPLAPSGLQDPLRPFVFRASSHKKFSIHVFDTCGETGALLIEALQPVSWTSSAIRCDLQPKPVPHDTLEIRFLTATDLRTATPDFATVFARARDRVSTLRSTYGPGPLDIDFRALGVEARNVELVASKLFPQSINRRSSGTGQIHPIGGFTGSATYSGDFSNFLPILRAAQYTGIGRKTVWGNGEIAVGEESGKLALDC